MTAATTAKPPTSNSQPNPLVGHCQTSDVSSSAVAAADARVEPAVDWASGRTNTRVV